MLRGNRLVRLAVSRGSSLTKNNVSCQCRVMLSMNRNFSSSNEVKKKTEDLKDTLNDIKKKYEDQAKHEGHHTEESQTSSQPSVISNVLNWARDAKDIIVDNVRLAYQEMIGETTESNLRKKVEQAESYKPAKSSDKTQSEDDDEDANKPPSPSAIVLVKEGKSTWEAMKERLQDSPFIREILKNSQKIGKAASETDIGKQAQNIGQNVKDKVSDMREFWETSQNPLVYTLSGIWDNVTGETEEGLATAAIRKLDPKFIKEDWAEDVRTNLAPKIIKAQLDGDLRTLKPWLGEAVYNKLAADIRVRKADAITIDSHILNIDENAIVMKVLDDDRPIIVVVYMVQQINCIRKKGEIIEVRLHLSWKNNRSQMFILGF